MRQPSREEMAREHRAKAEAQRKARREEARALAETRIGSTETIFGRILHPGELPSAAPAGNQSAPTSEESQAPGMPWWGIGS